MDTRDQSDPTPQTGQEVLASSPRWMDSEGGSLRAASPGRSGLPVPFSTHCRPDSAVPAGPCCGLRCGGPRRSAGPRAGALARRRRLLSAAGLSARAVSGQAERGARRPGSVRPGVLDVLFSPLAQSQLLNQFDLFYGTSRFPCPHILPHLHAHFHLSSTSGKLR